MNFKIYVENGLENSITSIDDYDYTIMSKGHFRPLIENHIASKISQCFLFFVTKELLDPINALMVNHPQSVYQFVVIGTPSMEGIDVNLSQILASKKTSVTRDDLKWYILKFDNYINVIRDNHNLNNVETKDYMEDQRELISIGQMLAVERNRDELIRKILMTSLKITGADAGSIFLVVDMEDGGKGLLFKYSFTFSRDIDFKEFIMPLNEKSISGFCAVNDEIVNIPDVYLLDKSTTFSFNSTFDENNDYVSRSMLVVPMKNHLGEMQGVIQLINSKEQLVQSDGIYNTESHKILLETKDDFYNKVFPFAQRYEDLMLSVAGQASVALDNIKMIKQLENQFEALVRASVIAIDSKDPATSGHSDRLSRMAVEFLNRLNSINYGKYKETFFDSRAIKQIEYAALLHDYGKVYIDDDIFLKAKKLYPKDLSILKLRLDLIVESLINSSACESMVIKVKEIRELIDKINEPGLTNVCYQETIDEILKFQNDVNVYDGDGNRVLILNSDDVVNLRIAKGTLNEKERKIIESHVDYTQKFLQSIPWPAPLSRIPEIAGGHHEMLNGTGYPNGLKGEEICIESRILAILDVFDALSASDRPYKDAVPFNRVQEILKSEAKLGRLDNDLLEVFFDYKVYQGVYSSDGDIVNV